MRLIVFFDLPMETAQDRRAYGQFRKYLLKNGFLMMQKSVYSKLAITNNICNTFISNLIDNAPDKGLIQILKVTEKQYANITAIAGDAYTDGSVNDTESFIIL